MGSLEEKRQRFKAQISELYRLAEEAEACASLLRQQAASHAELLEDDDLTEEKLDSLLADEPKQRFKPAGGFVLTEGLM
jgi:uncharacterized membrane protein affecting hemolysin expression